VWSPDSQGEMVGGRLLNRTKGGADLAEILKEIGGAVALGLAGDAKMGREKNGLGFPSSEGAGGI
jgi:hypothetical protein